MHYQTKGFPLFEERGYQDVRIKYDLQGERKSLLLSTRNAH